MGDGKTSAWNSASGMRETDGTSKTGWAVMPLDTTRKKGSKCSAKFSEKDFIAESEDEKGLETKHRESR